MHGYLGAWSGGAGKKMKRKYMEMHLKRRKAKTAWKLMDAGV